jgi:hypothetical protein
MSERGRFQGMISVARFNWPFFAIAGVVLAVALAALALAPQPTVRMAAALAAAGCLWFFIGSLGVSHAVYDRSDLYRWAWLARALGGMRPESIILCHAGFDEVSPALEDVFPAARWQVLDHYDPATMSEPSIHRARRLFPPTAGTLAARHDAWPPAEADLVFGLLAIHELRSDDDRAAWFAQARRSLLPGGRIVIAEHVRDLANFAAFGPGFMHFHSVASWRRSWEISGLSPADTFRITPFIRIFVLAAP